MLRDTSIRNKNIVIGIIITLTVLFEMSFLTLHPGRFTVILSSGVAAGFYISFGKKILPSIIICTSIPVFTYSLIINDSSLYLSFLYTISLLGFNLATIFILDYALEKLNSKLPITLKTSISYIITLILVVMLVSLLPAIQFMFSNNSNLWVEMKNNIKPSFTGLFVIGTTIIFSNQFDHPLNFKIKQSFKEIIYIIIFTVICILIFYNTEFGVDFPYFGPVFIILFLINAYAFSYRMLIYMSVIYIFTYNFLIDTGTLDRQITEISALNMYLLILISITIFTKVLIYNIKEKNESLTKSNLRLEEMMDSTISLIKIKNTLETGDGSYIRDFMNDVYKIALRIFPKFNYSICVLRTEGLLDIIETTGYDKNFIIGLKINSSSIEWDMFGPAKAEDSKTYFNKILGSRFTPFEPHFPDTSESMRFVIKIGHNDYGGILFDIDSKSKDYITQTDYDNIAAFQKLINSFYETNELSIKNSSLKDDIVLSLIRTLELYDQYTGGHSEDVAIISKAIAEKMNKDDEFIYTVYWAGIVHDIGKIGINSDIINKSGKLTLDEYQTVKKHPIYGFEILNKSVDLRQIAKLVKHHHEWYNGSGYPDGLSQDKIPLGAQILQVADSVSSMATKRSYTKVKKDDEIITELEMYKGTQFNPMIADVMIELISEGLLDDIYKERRIK